MKIEVKKILFDILTSINSIEEYLGEKRDFNIYSSNKMMRRAVEREFEIIGEALNILSKIENSIEISSKKQIIGLRNRVIHNYDKVDDEIIWGIINKYLPILKEEINNLIN